MLSEVVTALERRLARDGWDRPPQLFALVTSADLRDREPALAESLGITAGTPGPDLVPVAQDPLSAEAALVPTVEGIVWPETVAGCALAAVRVLAPDGAAPPAGEDEAAWAAAQPGSREVRLVAAALRDGSHYAALRFRDHDSDDAVLSGAGLLPGLEQALAGSLEE
ncbi:MAG: hypothetical protein GEV11_10070 [Streptosporangiales bacterium]|nr:hypothetical protein [Streptosporangiales bacterium]